MDAARYDQFTNTIHRVLADDAQVLGMVLLGSTANPALRDKWSDHDFWIVTEPGHQIAWLRDLFWLPNPDHILLSARHTRGHTALYDDGHVVEFAVLDLGEVATATIGSFRIVIDKGGVAAAVTSALAKSTPPPVDDARRTFLFSNFLILLQTATTRWFRDERLSARRYLSQFAVDALLNLVLGLVPASEISVRDPLDPRRRIEREMPDLAASLDRIVVADVGAASISLLDLAEQQLLSLWPSYPVAEAAAVRHLLTQAAAG